ncbi:unnamed protein product [Eruca vesicaria subsp. sativa]|uniref:Uncharacterized protein n=1 Tax=Eruca vesicaria subsp. sativa TaxID=29727 RepID=A0ABC8LRA6_ERUVS|nr:unnamed protein product [Eruca vesicaria subsp. sativa]
MFKKIIDLGSSYKFSVLTAGIWGDYKQPILPQEEDHAVVADEEDHAFVADDKAPSEKDEPVEPVVKRSVKRKVKDPGYEFRKQQLLCQRTAEQSRGLDEETKTFITGLFNTSFTTLKEELHKHVDHRFDKLDGEIAQLKQTVTSVIMSREDVPASTSPTPSKVKSPRPQRKVNKK